MRTWVLSAVCLLALAALAAGLPRPLDDPKESTPAQQTEDLRHKRTIGFLRSYFPTLTEILDRKIQTITRFLFRLIGRLVLGGDNGGGGTDASSTGGAGASSSSSSSGNGRRISITLPTYPPGLDDEDEEEDEDDNETAASANDVDANATSAGPEEVKSRVVRATATEEKLDAEKEAKEDQEAAADDQDARDKRFLFSFGRQSEEGGQGSGGGSGNFLFDLIRDTATRTARAAGGFYRMVAGTDGDEGGQQPIRYSPWLNGKQEQEPEAAASHLSLGVGLSGKASLIAGSGATEDANDHATTGPSAPSYYSTGAAAAVAETPEVDAKEDGYTSGIPGPITRLFVIANRGVSNLIQDLILRLAQTSERIVNFKARLITSII